MSMRAIRSTQDVDEGALLALARAWKLGALAPVHPTIGHWLNAALKAADEDAVPFIGATDLGAPSLVELIWAHYERARNVQECAD
jgi:hypothetical protein